MKRNLSRMFRTGVAAAAALLCAMPFQAAAEDYPSRPITLIMPFGAGNAPDTAARIIGDYLQRKHNITLLITSKPGGSGIPATLETVRARPDGYTISLTSANVLTVVPQYKKCGFTYKDLAPVAQVNVFTMGWGVRADSGIASVQDLMDKAKAERGKYSLASPGAFTAQRFYHANVMKLFPESDLPYVAYNGGAEIVTALLGNHISAGFTPVVNFKPHKDIRVIAVCGAQRDPNYPDAPTFKEMFGDGFVFDSVYGIVAPLKTPKDRIERLQSLIKEALSDPDVQAKFAKVNMTTNYLPADEFGKVIEGNLFGKSIPAPWCDTEICVKGDYFARHFGKEVTLCIDEYQAAAVDAHIDTLLIEQEAPNMNTTKSGYCAPATVQFSAIANTPTAALFNWKIYRQGEEDNPVVRFTGEEVDYTFNQSGTFIIKLEVSDQSTTCSTEDEVQIDISESYLMIPNAFSPGTTPGINDEFRVAYKSLVKFKAWIFNRWGLQMYYWTDPAQGWDGKKGGKYVQPGVYFYVIEAEGSDGIKYKEKGDINILRPKTIQDENENIQE